MFIVDSHCHLYYEPYINDLQKTIDESKSKNVNRFLSISVDLETSLKNIQISEKFNEVYCTIGLHPNNVLSSHKDLDKILNLYSSNTKIIGIGEAGIDLFRTKDNLALQIECFEKQIEFCIKNNLPIVVHSRNSEKETINVLQKFKNKNLKFILHCFSGTESFAKECIKLNGHIAFGGMITFKKSFNLTEICKQIPLNKLLVETDSPYLSPHPFRGKINHPQNTSLVVEKIAQIKQKKFEEISKITTNNFNELFKINYKHLS